MRKPVIVAIALLLMLKLASLMHAEPITYYAYLTDHEVTRFGEIIWFWTPDTLWGPIRSNDFIGIKYSPNFFGHVYTSKSEFRYYNPGNIYFAYPPAFNTPPYRFPHELTELEAQATTRFSSNHGRNVTWISFDGNRGADVCQYPLGGERIDSVVSHIGTNGRQIVWVDGQVDLEGIVAQQITIASTHDIYLLNDLRYLDSDEWGNFDEEHTDAMLGVASERNIIIANTEANGRGNGVQEAPNDLNRHSIALNGSYIALGESFTFEDQNDDGDHYHGPTPDERGVLYLTGGIAQSRRGYVHRSNHVGTGYGKRWRYDFRLLHDGPPGFGPGEYLDVHGEYDRMLMVPASYEVETARIAVLTIMPGATVNLHGASALLITDSLLAIGTADEPITFTGANGGGTVRVIQGGAYMQLEHVNFSEDVELEVEGETALINKCKFGAEVSLEAQLSIDSSFFGRSVALDGFNASEVKRSVMMRGVSVRGRGYSFAIENNTIIASRGAGILIQSGEGVEVRNNVIAYCRSGIVREGQDRPNIHHNCLYEIETDQYVNCTPGEGAIDGDPRFIDRRHENFQIGWGSPCIDAGDPISTFDPDSTRSDIGAFYLDHILSVPESEGGGLVRGYDVTAAPNPFNSSVTVRFRSEAEGEVTLKIHDLQGRVVATLFEGRLTAGTHSFVWADMNAPAGLYLLRAGRKDRIESMKLVKVD